MKTRHLSTAIQCGLREIDYWKGMSVSVSAARYDGMPHNPNRPTEAGFEKCIEKIDGLQRDISSRVSGLIALRNEITERIGSMEDSDERLVLHYRYIEGCSWEDIAWFLNVSVRTVHRIHGSALQHFPMPE